MWPFKTEKRATSIENPGVPISANNIMELLGWDTQTESGINVTPEKALSVPAVWAAVNFISGTIASLPLHVYRKTKDGRESAKADPLTSLLHDAPNPEQTSFAWRKYGMQQTLLRGRQYTYIERAGNGKIKALWALDPVRTTPAKRGFSTVYEYRHPDGRTTVYHAEEIIDIPFMLEHDQVTHISPISRMRDTIGLGIVLQSYAHKYFKNGGVPPLALEGPFKSPGAVERAAEDLTNAIKNAAAAGRQVLPIPLEHTLKQIGFNPEQGQMIDARRFVLEEVARMFNLSPIFLQDLSKGTYSNTEQQDLHVVKHTLTHWVKSIEQEMNLKLFTATGGKRFVEFNMDGLLRGDFKTRMEGYSTAIQNSISTPNEVRAKENSAPKDGGDELFIQQNMSGLNRLGEKQSGN